MAGLDPSAGRGPLGSLPWPAGPPAGGSGECLPTLAARLTEGAPRAAARVTLSRLLLGYAKAVTGPPLAAWFAGLPLPDVSAANVRVTGSTPADLRMILLDSRLLLVTDDLAGAVRRMLLDGHFVPLIGELTRTGLAGQRLLWGNVAAEMAGVLARAAAVTGDTSRARQIAAELLDSPGAPVRGLVRIGDFGYQGRRYLTVRRTTCCLKFQLPGRRYCTACKFTEDQTRHARLAAALSRRDPAVTGQPGEPR